MIDGCGAFSCADRKSPCLLASLFAVPTRDDCLAPSVVPRQLRPVSLAGLLNLDADRCTALVLGSGYARGRLQVNPAV
ncbi:hypothetical protein trd_1467 [Thermomicrobium roseum DSM 5159]|uniref:Uncharacterized protein n=1 Tax=Thermomicrobium roseum (strain ATCC 27502 / DSM 5159 / P-2) TaxID=309801 RepID=B9KZJ7_THERP|nr:hypothetical protein trd_1467 [Thermomicrobium roseum DSM 5159]